MAIATRMQNPATMANAIGYEGFSWTTLFFGPLPALLRGDVVGFLAMLITAVATFGFSGLVWIFVYNRWHYNRLLGKGFQPSGHFALNNTINIINAHGYPAEAQLQRETVGRPQARPAAIEIRNRAPQLGFGRRGA